MGKDIFDASVGLAFSLALFERYRKNGLLQAELRHVPGIRGRCKGYLQLVEGKVTYCYIEDKDGQRRPMSKETLIRLDNERGPFEWMLVPLPAPPSPTPRMVVTPQAEQNSPTPRIIAPLHLERLEGWTNSQKMMLSVVYEAINGQRNIEAIKVQAGLPPNVTEEALRILLALKVISIV
ncbi:hypothetical protein EPA93_35220 [Ktedonosporobacter rubrisoli]|uniref:DUF4388 domain-containing protein n=1 Tax=Ktedonosporobacter rubrisoli TaxID=2509675 RepID=A0A4P6JYX5_KTERU|nr:hypothetical protein [Ktedonosporobacter rubrisoli]QBD80939.1 hypothetical protein EPA93_35220 [Ktedonosporobacter rubrisoli]